jgi:hypothetical protein
MSPKPWSAAPFTIAACLLTILVSRLEGGTFASSQCLRLRRTKELDPTILLAPALKGVMEVLRISKAADEDDHL